MVKIFDIAPPDQKAEEGIQIKEVQKRAAERFSSGKKLFPLLAGAALLTAAVLSYFTIPHKAKIELWPEKRTIEETVIATVSDANGGENFIKGIIMESEKTVSQNFAAQGIKLKSVKAQGAIRVYNNYSDAPQVLVATTRFISDGGKLFRTAERVLVPGGHYEGGKLAAGFVDIKVTADQPGEEYNIGESTFSIPGFAGTPRYTAFYAKSFSPMSGGIKKEVLYVAQQDINKAKEALTKTALEENDFALRNAVSSGKYILIDNAVSAGAADFKASAELGQEADNFSAQITVASKAMVFEERALADFSKNYAEGKLAPGEKLIERFLETEYSAEKVDLEENKISLKISISAQSHSAPDDIKIKGMIKNKRLEEIDSILRGLPQIIKAKVEFWPFWVNLAPEKLDSIEVVLQLD